MPPYTFSTGYVVGMHVLVSRDFARTECWTMRNLDIIACESLVTVRYPDPSRRVRLDIIYNYHHCIHGDIDVIFLIHF